MFREENIGKLILSSSVLLVVLLTLSLGSLLIFDKLHQQERDLQRIEQIFIAQLKNILKVTVTQQIERFDARRAKIKIELKEKLKSRVSMAHAVALNDYQKYKESKSTAEIKSLIQDRLRVMKFNDNKDGFFILSLQDGRIIQGISSLSSKGKGQIKQLTEERQKGLQGLIEIGRNQGEGFSEYPWPKVDSVGSQLPRKITFVSLFKPYDWLIGISECHEKIDSQAKETIIKEFSKSTDIHNKNYYFVYQLHTLAGGDNFATMLVNPNRPDLVGTQLSDSYKDAIGQEFRKFFLKDLREKGESFTTYWYKKPGDPDPKRKLSYFKLYPEANWILARGIYFDDLDENLAREKKVVSQVVNKELGWLVLFLSLFVGGTIFLAVYFTKGITAILEKYKATQKEQYEELERMNMILEKQVTTDALTDLHNKKFFNTQLDKELARSQRYGTPLSLIIFDIDKFKQINDTFGHLSGDGVVTDLAHLVRGHVRQSDLLARWGGDEFVILTSGNSKDEAVILAEKLRNRIESHSFPVNCQVTCSFGVAEYSPGEKSNDFISRADKLLYSAKSTGRNKVESVNKITKGSSRY